MNNKVRRKNYILEGFDRIFSPMGKIPKKNSRVSRTTPTIRLKTFDDDTAKLRGDWEKIGQDLYRAVEKYNVGIE